MQNAVQVEGNEYLSVQDVIDWLSILEPSQAVCNSSDRPFSCLNDFKFVCGECASIRQNTK